MKVKSSSNGQRSKERSNGNNNHGPDGHATAGVNVDPQPIALKGVDSGAEIGVAVLGCGSWGANYVRIFNEFPNARVVVVCDVRPDRLLEIQRRFPGIQATTDVDEGS